MESGKWHHPAPDQGQSHCWAPHRALLRGGARSRGIPAASCFSTWFAKGLTCLLPSCRKERSNLS